MTVSFISHLWTVIYYTNTYHMFRGCYEMSDIDLLNFQFKVSSLRWWFNTAQILTFVICKVCNKIHFWTVNTKIIYIYTFFFFDEFRCFGRLFRVKTNDEGKDLKKISRNNLQSEITYMLQLVLLMNLKTSKKMRKISGFTFQRKRNNCVREKFVSFRAVSLQFTFEKHMR